jgi:hypothetical protein
MATVIGLPEAIVTGPPAAAGPLDVAAGADETALTAGLLDDGAVEGAGAVELPVAALFVLLLLQLAIINTTVASATLAPIARLRRMVRYCMSISPWVGYGTQFRRVWPAARQGWEIRRHRVMLA